MLNHILLSKCNFTLKLHSLPLNQTILINNRIQNQIYNINNSKIEKIFYKDLFPLTYEYLSQMKKLNFISLTLKDYSKIKKATEILHQIFLNTTKSVLHSNEPYIYEKFGIEKSNWEYIKHTFTQRNNDYLYGRMDLGFNFDLTNIKLFEYNTGLCGDIYDSTHFQHNVFNSYAINNKNVNLSDDIKNSFHSGKDLIGNLAKQFKSISSNCHNKKIYFICTPSKEEELILLSFIEALQKYNMKYKICYYAKGIKKDYINNCLIDTETNTKIDIVYKTYAWYKIFKEIKSNKNNNNFFNYFLTSNTKIIEPPWKTVMGNKALLPYVYQMNKTCPYLIPSSFNPFDKCFGKDKYIIQKGIFGRGSKMVNIINRNNITKLQKGVIYQKVFTHNKLNNDFYIMGSWLVGSKFSGCLIKKSNKLINEYNCNIIPVRVVNKL